MTRYIDADALIADCNVYNSWDAQIVKAWVDDQPTVDAVPVRHGKWTQVGKRAVLYRCSNCKELYPYATKCCPNCGTKMDGVGK